MLSFATDGTLTAQQIIQQMSEANRKLSYKGIFVYRHLSQMDTVRIIHKANEEGIQEKIVSLTGPAREIIRNKDSVTCITPDKTSLIVEKSSFRQFKLNQLSEQVGKVSKYYIFAIAGQGRVAGRYAWILDILPRDEYRYGYQLWVDIDTKLLLKSELKNNKGTALEQFFFTELEIMQEISDELFKPNISGVGYILDDNSMDNLATDNKDMAWRAAWVPDGFLMREQGRRSIEQGQILVDHLLYSDGLALISVFIEKFEKYDNIITGFSNVGGINAFSTITDKHLVTAIGEVPGDTIKLFARSITPIK